MAHNMTNNIVKKNGVNLPLSVNFFLFICLNQLPELKIASLKVNLSLCHKG